jgi:hypothetical protein
MKNGKRKFKLVRRSRGNPIELSYSLHLFNNLIRQNQVELSEIEKTTFEMEKLFYEIGTAGDKATISQIRKARRLWKKLTENQPVIERLLELSAKYMKILGH